MEALYKQIKRSVIKNVSIIKNKPPIDKTKVFSDICFNALVAIRAVLNDHTLDDKECFKKIEKIVEIYEAIGSDGGSRHDFG